MNRDTRAKVLAALREVYDGRWDRNVGTDGGRTLDLGRPARRRRRRHDRMGHRARRHRRDGRSVRAGPHRLDHGPAWPPVARPSATPATRSQMRAELAEAVGRRHRRDEHRRRSRSTDDETERCSPPPTSSPWPAPASSTTTGATSSTRTRPRCRPGSPSSSPRSCAAASRSAWTGPTRCGSPSAAPATRCRRCGWPSSTTWPEPGLDADGCPQAARQAPGHRRPAATGAAHARRGGAPEEGVVGEIRESGHYSLTEGIDPDALSVQRAPLPEKSVGTHSHTKKGQKREASKGESSRDCTGMC